VDYCYNVRCWLTQLAVQKGDTLTVTAPGYYPHPVQVSSFAFSLAAFVAGLLQQQQPAMPGGPDGNGRTRPLPLLSISIRGSRYNGARNYGRVLAISTESPKEGSLLVR